MTPIYLLMKTNNMKEKNRLNLGSGDVILEGYVNLDITKLKGVDVVHDINKLPLPFPDNRFEGVVCEHILCYSKQLFRLMEELWRICKPGSIIRICETYPGNKTWWTDPNRRSQITEHTFPKYFGDQRFSYYSKARFNQRFVHIQRNRRNPFVKENIHIKLEVVK